MGKTFTPPHSHATYCCTMTHVSCSDPGHITVEESYYYSVSDLVSPAPASTGKGSYIKYMIREMQQEVW